MCSKVMITLIPINSQDIDAIKNWKQYDGAHSQMDYAIRENGWLDTYCGESMNHCFAAKEEEICVGFSILIDKKEREAEFRVAVSPDFIGSGYGRKIINNTLTLGFEVYKYKIISLIVRKNNPYAIKLYQRHGFILYGETTENIQGQCIEFFKMKIDNEHFAIGEN